MAARAMWKAEIVADTLRVPVKLYAAVQDKNIRFRLLHEADMMPVVQQMVNPASGNPVPEEEIRKGLEVEPGVYVTLTDEEQAALDPPESREIMVERVVNREIIDERWYDRPYYLGPDGDTDLYFSLVEAMAGGEKIGIAQWTMRKKRYVGALLSSNGYLMLETLRFTEELVRLADLSPAAHRAPDNREIALAEQLIAALEDDFNAADYRDEYREQVLDLVKSKSEGKILQFPKQKAAKPTSSLLNDLEASLKKTKAANAR
jgi:DNA end-binding protein Ku